MTDDAGAAVAHAATATSISRLRAKRSPRPDASQVASTRRSSLEELPAVAATFTPPPPPPPAAPLKQVAARAVGATKVYGVGDTQVVALNNLSIDFGEGEFTAIMGPSGSGKSTLMHCVAGLDWLTSGQVIIGGTDLSQLNQKQLTLLRRDQVGFIFQSFNLVPTLSAKENITLPLDLAGRKPDHDWFQRVVDTVGLHDRLRHKPSELSGGQQQRVAVARALAMRPHIIFADEPTGNLDSRSGGEILDFMRQAVDEFGQTIVMVTHDAGAAARADRVVFLADGSIVSEMREPSAERVLDEMKRLGDI
jgi:putative ABC transport system ATP-binding protein